MRYTSAEAGTSKKKRKSELLELWLCLTRSMIGVTSVAVLTGGFFARGVKNESRHRCGFIVSISHGEKKTQNILIGKHEITAQARGGHWKFQLPKRRALKFFWDFYHHVFL